MDNKKIRLSKQQRTSYGLIISCLYHCQESDIPNQVWIYYVKIFIIQLQFDLLCANKKSKKHDKNIFHTLLLGVYYKLSKRCLHIFVLHLNLNAAWKTFFFNTILSELAGLSDTLNVLCIKKWSNEIHVQVEVKYKCNKHIFFLLEKWSVS